MNILVRNLPKKMTEGELMALFEPFGEVISLNLVYDSEAGTSKGFGFVEMPNSREGLTAIKKLNGQNIGGNRIRVKVAEKK